MASVFRSRTSKLDIPQYPMLCPLQRACVYRDTENRCDDPRSNKGNSDAACHRMKNGDLRNALLGIPGPR